MTTVLIDSPDKERALEKAIVIGDELLRQALVTPCGLTWPVEYSEDGRGLTWQQPESIYSGVSGIVLFLTELYRHTQHKTYLEAAKEGMRWVVDYCHKNATQQYGFYIGRLGVAYVLLKLHAITHQPTLLTEALDMAKPVADSYLTNEHTTSALFDGRAGALLVLLHLHQASQEPWLVGTITACIDTLLDQASYDQAGICWDRSRNSVQGLCGLAHGAAGIGYVFAELGQYVNNAAFLAVARQAFDYENQYWHEVAQNWPDFRKDITTPERELFYQQAYLNHDLEAFAGTFTNTSLAHGTAGIGLTRLAAVEAYQTDVSRAATALAERHDRFMAEPLSIRQQSVYAGLAGEGVFFLEAYKATAEPMYLQHAHAIGLLLQAQAEATESTTSDLGLLTGQAGLGYFYLQLARPTAESVLLPRLRSENLGAAAGLSGFSGSSVQRKIVAGSFPRVVKLMDEWAPEQLASYLEREAGELLGANTFIDRVRQWVPQLPDPGQEFMQQALAIESSRFSMKCGVNNAYLAMHERFAQVSINQILDVSDEVLRQTYFTINEQAILLSTKQDEFLLYQAGAGLTEDTLEHFMQWYGSQAVLLMPSGDHDVQEYGLFMELMILTKFTVPTTPGKVCDELTAFFMPNTELFIQQMAYFCMIHPGDVFQEQFDRLMLQLIKKHISVGVLLPLTVPGA
ncbi:lanthionine synthetase LanC family protein [Fibrella aquatilis]|uniref:Lanthionine synthetase C-like protein n=1 Tax=Fibrella aquatilis TaxID=2817059 RepID=A0A939G823_9BACT|nr:lanthionine synthetase LanC family protein [Fibrella aquatilis]MBO0933586.1 hypothetical protein [Fibrella aquatilis]